MTKTEAYLWLKAHDKLTKKYGELVDPKILLRFYHEKALLGNSNWIVFLDLIAKLKKRAKERGTHLFISGSVGASFAGYLLGATENNPLPLHYHCRSCKNTERIDEKCLPWDVSSRRCVCGHEMVADGFDLPCEMLKDGVGFRIFTSFEFIEEAIECMKEEMSDYKIVEFEIPVESDYHRYYFLPYDDTVHSHANRENEKQYDGFPCIVITPLTYQRKALQLEEATGIPYKDVIPDSAILESMLRGDIDSVPIFSFGYPDFMKNLIETTHPKNYTELLTLLGLAHGTGTWKNNAELLIPNGTYTLSDIPAHRDDVFMTIRDEIRKDGNPDVGFAVEAAFCAARGHYAREGMPFEHEILLTEYGEGERMIEYLKKVQYMFHKAHSVQYLKDASRFMWYKMNYPAVYEKIMTEEEGT